MGTGCVSVEVNLVKSVFKTKCNGKSIYNCQDLMETSEVNQIGYSGNCLCIKLGVMRTGCKPISAVNGVCIRHGLIGAGLTD
jgi:hypothetical protein